MNVHFSQQTDAWDTPQDLFLRLDSEYHFQLDTCATEQSTKCPRYYTEENSGLDNDWAARNWCNPPYSELAKWVLKARREQLKGNMTVMLVPARTDTACFHDSIYNQPNVELRFLRGRLKFGSEAHWRRIWEQPEINGKRNPLFKKYGRKNSAPFPSMLVIFHPRV